MPTFGGQLENNPDVSGGQLENNDEGQGYLENNPQAVDSLAQEVGNFWSTSHQQYRYEGYSIAIAYQWNEGILQLPVAAPVNPDPSVAPTVRAEIVRLHAPVGSVVVTWGAVRVGYPPEVPWPYPPSLNSRYKLKEAVVVPEQPALGADGLTFAFKVSGVYSYVLTLPIHPTEGYRMGAAPVHTLAAQALVFSAAQFVRTIFAFDQ